MTIHGWRQLIEWSLEHSCMSPTEREGVKAEWENRWYHFLEWVVAQYSGDVEEEKAREAAEAKMEKVVSNETSGSSN